MNLTTYQHLDLIKALSEQAGGEMRFLHNTYPAFKGETGGWYRFDSLASVDVFKALDHLSLKITDIPLSKDRLGGGAKLKDHTKLLTLLKSQLSNNTPQRLEAEPLAQALVQTLSDSGMSAPDEAYQSTLIRALKQSRSPIAIAGYLENSGVRSVWPVHHPRMQTPPPSNDALQTTAFGGRVFKQKDRLYNALVLAAKEHYMRPEMFALEVHAALHNQNVALAFQGEPAHLESPADAVNYYLKDLLKAYARDGVSAFKRALKDLDLVYSPLQVGGPSISKTQGVQLLRKALGQQPRSNNMTPQKNEGEAIKGELALNVQSRKVLWAWRGVLNEVIKQEPGERQKAIDLAWQSRIDSHNIGIDTPQKTLSTLIDKVETLYGPLVNKHKDEHVHQLLGKIAILTQRAPAIGQMLTEFVEQVLDRPSLVQQYELSEALTEVLTDDYIGLSVKNHVDNGVLPDLSEFYQKMTNEPLEKFNYNEQPEYSLTRK